MRSPSWSCTTCEGNTGFGVFEEFWERALVIDVGVGDAQGRCAALGKGCDVHGFVVVG